MNASSGLIIALACAAIGIIFGIVWAIAFGAQADTDALRQILFDLVLNASDAMPTAISMKSSERDRLGR